MAHLCYLSRCPEWPAVLFQLGTKNCPANIYAMFKSFLSDRKVTYECEDFVIRHEYNKGCPQGSNSGPTLWNVVADSALELDLGSHTTIQAYADDFLVVVGASGRQTIEAEANRALKKLEEWSSRFKLNFAEEKSQLLYITWTGKDAEPPRIKFKGVSIKSKRTMKYLGITLDTGLTWIPHINEIGRRIEDFTRIVHSQSRGIGGLDGAVSKAVYKGGLERIMTYACGAWCRKPTNKMRRQVQSKQRRALLQITKCYRTTSTVALQVLAGTLPIDLQLDIETAMFQFKKEQNIEYGNYELHYLDQASLVRNWERATPVLTGL